MKNNYLLLICSLSVLLVACDSRVRKGINKLDGEALKVQLGELLFFDKELSKDGSIACASCHQPEKAFTDGKKVSHGIFGRTTERNAPSLLNMDAQPHFMWDGGVPTLAMQALVPLQDTNEMGSSIRDLVAHLSQNEVYANLAKEAFGSGFDAYVLTQSLAAFQESLLSRASPFDRWYTGGDSNAISIDAQKGYELFSTHLKCISCHALPDFTDHSFVNKGLYLEYNDAGRNRITHKKEDIGKFKVPSLRNVSLTAPYMHDGIFTNLEEVIQHTVSGGGNHPNKDARIQTYELTDKETQQLIRFLESLTDTSYMVRFQSHN